MSNLNVLFVHIPKTGGTSVRKFLDINNLECWKRSWPMGHDPFFDLEENNNLKNTFTFTIVRNPYTRAYSYYRHFLVQNKTNITFIEFLTKIRRKQATKFTPMICFNQSFYVFNSVGLNSLHRIYKYENLNDLEVDFEIILPHERKGDYDQTMYEKDYSETAINLVKHIYLEDFVNFNYSFDFNDSKK